MRKRIVSLALCCLMLCTGGVQAFAAESTTMPSSAVQYSISPYMDYIAQANGTLYINSNGTATVDCDVYGYQGTTTRVEISANLQQYKNGRWVTIKTFTASSNSHRTSLSETHSVSKGYSYRVQATIKAYSGSSVETRTVTSSEASY
ncbi:MAG: hypothetical protein RSF40_09860 [Oscillospiraceae bacterium]